MEEHTPTPQEARGIYGFVFFLLLKISIIFYFIWMLLPLSVIQSLPYAPPQQYWGLAVPVFVCTGLFVFAFGIYPALHGLNDCNFDDVSSITDPDSHSEDYFETVKCKTIAMSTAQQVRRRKSPRKAFKVNTEIHEKSKTLSEKAKKFRAMQIRPMKSFPESDSKPIPPACDLELDTVCKRIYMTNLKNE